MNKTVIISGGSSGVGLATSELLASKGANVVFFSHSELKMEAALKSLRKKHASIIGITGDVRKEKDVKKVFKLAVDTYGGVDVLVNNAGVPARGILSMPVSTWQAVLDINLFGYLLMSRYAIDEMRKRNGGHIINIGSLCNRVLDSGPDIYVAAKKGVEGFTHSLRKQLVKEHIKVSLINPGAIGTGMVTETEREIKQKIAKGAMLAPEDVAQAIYYCLTQPARVDITELELRPHLQSDL